MFPSEISELKVYFNKSQIKLFDKYIEEFKIYNSHTNLISKNDEKVLFEKHIFDSLAFNLFAEKYNFPETLLDIGTGGGFPSVPISLAYSNIKVTAVDSTEKKINFLKQLKEKLKLQNINPVAARIEELPIEYKEKFDVVTTRALSSLPVILEYAVPYLKTGGYFIAYKSLDSEKELERAKNALKLLNTVLTEVIEYKLPLEENFNRKLLIFKKNTNSCIFKFSYIMNTIF